MKFINAINSMIYQFLCAINTDLGDFEEVILPIKDAIGIAVGVFLAIGTAVLAIVVWIKTSALRKAKTAEERDEAKKSLINWVLGITLPVLLIVVLTIAIPIAINWMNGHGM